MARSSAAMRLAAKDGEHFRAGVWMRERPLRVEVLSVDRRLASHVVRLRCPEVDGVQRMVKRDPIDDDGVPGARASLADLREVAG
jgi:hypothetical protein